MKPIREKRTDMSVPVPEPVFHFDGPLLSDRERYGAHIQYRVGNNIVIDHSVLKDSGILSTDQCAQRNKLISEQVCKLLLSCDIKCSKCSSKIPLEVTGAHYATALTFYVLTM